MGPREAREGHTQTVPRGLLANQKGYRFTDKCGIYDILKTIACFRQQKGLLFAWGKDDMLRHRADYGSVKYVPVIIYGDNPYSII